MLTPTVAVLLADVAPSSASWILPAAVLAVLAFFGFVAARLVGKRRAELSDDEAPQLDTDRAAPPATDPLAEREQVDAPVRVTEGMSLKEIKEARRARLSEEYKSSDAVAAEKERRKGRRVDTPDDEAPAASPDSTEAPAAPDAAETEAPAAPAEAPAADAAPAEPASADATPEADEAPEPAATPEPAEAPAPVETPAPAAKAEPTPAPAAEPERRSLADGLSKTRNSGFLARIGSIFGSKTKLDEDVLEELEEVLFTADIGVQTSQKLLEIVQTRFESGELEDANLVWALLRQEIEAIFDEEDPRLVIDASKRPFVVMVVGVNGAGKTTSIGKLAARWSREGSKVMMIAGDTFRAAAVDQLVEWGDRVGCPVHRGEDGADPSSVVFDGLKRAAEEGVDVVLVDTAGRLQTKRPLMDELQKIGRVADKAVPGAPHETVLVLDANTGQNAIQQAKLFGEATPLTGLVLTKLDGTAKGGVVIGIRDELGLPIYYIGIGEAVDDLRAFHASEFVDALF